MTALASLGRPAAIAMTLLALASPALAQSDAAKRSLFVTAFFSSKGDLIKSGIEWRVFRARADESGTMPIAAQSEEASPTFVLDPGVYVVHAAYGLAGATRRVEISNANDQEKFILNAGALKIGATVANQPVELSKLTSRISAILPSGERHLIAENVPADKVVRLPEGQYYIDSTYGDLNAMVSAEISVKAGQMTDATFHHQAASMTLKLVNQPGGEAMADTSWSVLTPGGDVIKESIGAFPSMILAEGTYTVVARHEGRVYTREFDVKSGVDQDVEVMAK